MGAAGANGDANYIASIPIYPATFAGAFQNGGAGNLLGFSPNTTKPLGWARIIGTSPGSTALFKKCVVLNCKIKVTLQFSTISNQAAIPAGVTDFGYHYWHERSLDETVPTAATTAATNDSLFCQPDVKRKIQGNIQSVSAYNTAGTLTNTPQHIINRKVVWSRTIWPHKCLDIPFSQYVGEETSYGSDTAAPALQSAILDLVGYIPAYKDSAIRQVVPGRGYADYNVIFTCLFKEPLAALT